ncbi:MAG: type II toxin-antitoxin system HicA family toxin [Muribaculaceae bacterium]|nr:type II toxin-antitoxin system HicA family toxin [Muribaculaceae bacterium]
MGTKEKLIERFKSSPSDFTWNEYCRLFSILGFELNNKGKTSGSRVIFKKEKYKYIAHKPHPEKFMKEYVLKQTLNYLLENNLI